MVRLLKVKELDDRKRFLLARSEMYRQTLTLEVANIKFATSLLKRRLKAPKTIFMLLGTLALPAAGFFAGRRGLQKKAKAPPPPTGLLPALFAGWKLFSRLVPLVKKLRPARKPSAQPRQNLYHHQ
ncbi:MAG TPA: hypothetical protein VG754_00220 [Verrucomicrobiae bacterium]|nr:hypothetical protein [Verrucomicrobiae bacterium]